MGRWSCSLIFMLFISAESARISMEVDDEQPVWNFSGLVLNSDPHGPLLPGAVPPPGTIFEVVNKEIEGTPKGERVGSIGNDYKWAFLAIDQGGDTIPVDQCFAKISGEGFISEWGDRTDLQRTQGTRRTVVRNNLDEELFIIEASRPRTASSWRIRHPVTNATLFTINKDYFGAGFMNLREEWRIYRGRERDADQIYYIIADYRGHNHSFYHNEDEYQNSMTPAAQSRIYDPRLGTEGFVSETVGVSVGPGEDTALILSATIVIDMRDETNAAAERFQTRSRHHQRVRHARRVQRRRERERFREEYGYRRPW